MQLRTLGIDPGIKNFAVALLDGAGLVVYAGMVHSTIASTAQANAGQRPQFRRDMHRLLARLKPDQAMAEQFLVRGFAANIIELIALMLGGIQVMLAHRGAREYMTSASTWKQKFRRAGFDLEVEYVAARALGLPPHVLDATLLATYLHLERDFSRLTPARLRENVRRAARLLDVSDRVQPKREAKGRLDGLSGGGGGRGRRVPPREVLVLAPKGARAVRRERRGKHPPAGGRRGPPVRGDRRGR